MKVSEHLGEFHKAAADHHTQMIGAHEAALTKAKDMKEGGEHLTAFHKSAIASHQTMADYHEAAMEECSKAIAASDLAKNRIVPDGVRGIIPNAPGVIAVPRAGQRQLDKTVVDTELEGVLALPDDE
jgi:hypothetical protein